MTYTPQQWKNVLAHEGRIDHATIKIARQAVELSDKIEGLLIARQATIEETIIFKLEAMIKQYANKYKEVTGDWYVRSFP